MEPLSSSEKKELRGIAQRMKPHVHIGRNGLADSVLQEMETALRKNGLVKVRFEADRDTVKDHCERLPALLQCECVGAVGKTAVFFREMPEEN